MKWKQGWPTYTSDKNRFGTTVGSINYWKYCSITEPPPPVNRVSGSAPVCVSFLQSILLSLGSLVSLVYFWAEQKHTFCRGPSNKHPFHVWFLLVKCVRWILKCKSLLMFIARIILWDKWARKLWWIFERRLIYNGCLSGKKIIMANTDLSTGEGSPTELLSASPSDGKGDPLDEYS
jgi:hypothetical protein